VDRARPSMMIHNKLMQRLIHSICFNRRDSWIID